MRNSNLLFVALSLCLSHGVSAAEPTPAADANPAAPLDAFHAISPGPHRAPAPEGAELAARPEAAHTTARAPIDPHAGPSPAPQFRAPRSRTRLVDIVRRRPSFEIQDTADLVFARPILPGDGCNDGTGQHCADRPPLGPAQPETTLETRRPTCQVDRFAKHRRSARPAASGDAARVPTLLTISIDGFEPRSISLTRAC